MLKHLKDVWSGKAKLFSRRSSRWPTIRKHFLETHNSCAACGYTEHLEVHHIQPFHEKPELELEPTNFITLCDKPGKDNCHLEVGHLGNYHNSNPNVIADAAEKLKKSKLN